MQIFFPEDLQRAQENMGKVLKGETLGGNEYRLVKKDGSIFHAVIYSSPIIANDQVRGIRGIVLDISERLKMEDVLKQSEEKFRNLFNTMDWFERVS